MINDLQVMAADIAEMKAALLQTKTVFAPKEAAKYMGISLSTLYKLTSAGILPYSKPNGKLIYFSRQSLDNWLLSYTTTSADEKDTKAATYISTK
jgi:excisionase family DNA binding protein